MSPRYLSPHYHSRNNLVACQIIEGRPISNESRFLNLNRRKELSIVTVTIRFRIENLKLEMEINVYKRLFEFKKETQ